MKATFIVPYPPGRAPGQRFRFEQWLRLLPHGAIEADIRPLFDARTYDQLYRRGHTLRKTSSTAKSLAQRVQDAIASTRGDVAFLYREAFPLGPPLIETFVEKRVPVIYDFDDAIFLGGTSEANAFLARFKQPEKVDRIIELSRITTVGNEYLARHARHFADHVHVLPSTIDIDQYRPLPRRGANEKVRVGWSGSPTTSAHLRTIQPVLHRIVKELPVELVVMGDPDFKLDYGTRITVRPWRAETESHDVGSFDIGLMPLPDDEWSRGKCGLKALLYMALGVPPIVSPVGVNCDIVSHGSNGLVASTEEQWFEAVARLVENAGQRIAMGELARATVVERYSGQAWAPKFLEILESAAV